MNQLISCPFCESTEPIVHLQMSYTIEDDKKSYCIMCEECGGMTGDYETIQEAIKAWNKRGESNV